MARVTLKDASGRPLVVQQGESCDVIVSFVDMTGAAIAKAALASLTATLFDEEQEAIINSRDGQNVLDANQGTVTTGGVLTLRLQPADSPIVGSIAVGDTERHVLRLTWTWSDGVATRTGIAEWAILVERLA